MEKIEYHDVNKFLHLKDNTFAQIKAELDALWILPHHLAP